MTAKKLTAEQQACVDRARAAAEGPDKADLIRQAKASQKPTEVESLIITQLRTARESAGISLRESLSGHRDVSGFLHGSNGR